LTKDAKGFIDGANFADEESGQIFQAKTKVVINATGAFCDAIRRMSDAGIKPLVAPSQGIHLVFRREFLPTENAIMIPHTTDGRILFAIPWHNHTLVGTTDTPVEKAQLEPSALEEEIEFVLETAGKYLHKPPQRKDVLSVFAGIRPLVKNGGAKNTATLSRDHTIQIDDSGLITLTGGKWTTYRHMAEDCINQAAVLAKLPEKDCATKDLKIHGFIENSEQFGDLAIYGADASEIQKLIAADKSLGEKLHADLPYTLAEIVWSIRNEAARTIEDVLARRTRALFLNARAAIEIAPKIAEITARELDKDEDWIERQIREFNETAEKYLIR
jgi:glycerol-3-phosphate dehydrogenase